MNKLISIILLVMVLLTAFVYGFQILNKEKVENSIGNGTVLEVKDSSIVIQGFLESSTEEKKIIVVEFVVDENTKFTKTTLMVDTERHSGGEPFTPEMVDIEGNLSDLRKGTNIKGVKTNDILVNGGNAKALEINYVGVSFR